MLQEYSNLTSLKFLGKALKWEELHKDRKQSDGPFGHHLVLFLALTLLALFPGTGQLGSAPFFMRPISSALTISSCLARVRYKMNKLCSQNARGFQLDQTDPHCNSSSLFTAVRTRGLKGRNNCSCSYGVGVGAGGRSWENFAMRSVFDLWSKGWVSIYEADTHTVVKPVLEKGRS